VNQNSVLGANQFPGTSPKKKRLKKMAKRFSDTNKFKKPFYRNLPGPYKLLWDYICLDCDHAGIWIVDFVVAQIYVGEDMPVEFGTALQTFGDKILMFDSGERWFIPSFVEFQYGELNPNNNAHNSVLGLLKKHGLPNKGLISPSDEAMDKDKDKDKVKDKVKGGFKCFYSAYPKKKSKSEAEKSFAKINPDKELFDKIMDSLEEQKLSHDWQKENGTFVPNPSTWLNNKRWEDETKVAVAKKKILEY